MDRLTLIAAGLATAGALATGPVLAQRAIPTADKAAPDQVCLFFADVYRESTERVRPGLEDGVLSERVELGNYVECMNGEDYQAPVVYRVKDKKAWWLPEEHREPFGTRKPTPYGDHGQTELWFGHAVINEGIIKSFDFGHTSLKPSDVHIDIHREVYHRMSRAFGDKVRSMRW